MTVTIAVAGKGGTGKTTFAALTIEYLLQAGRTPVLAIDGDPSSNLNLALGLPLEATIGQIREEARDEVSSGRFQAGISKPDYFAYKVYECLVEGEGVDLLAMGRPEGPTCYCAANNMLRSSIDRLGNRYAWVVIDNEAGMEHISRQTTRNVDHLFIITDPTMRGVEASRRIVELTHELGTRIGQSYLVINRVSAQLQPALLESVGRLGVPLVGRVPEDPQVAALDMVGRPLVELGHDSPVYQAIAD
ncbi:MAG: cellulose synthase operon protein YhjQ/BcsQ, partial [Anaerolineae bacterium]|nr:cellulose synthase operon protein YhjQ/BcsQ [Anaerolineae bacterium]